MSRLWLGDCLSEIEMAVWLGLFFLEEDLSKPGFWHRKAIGKRFLSCAFGKNRRKKSVEHRVPRF